MISASRQRLFFESGLVSMTRTVSPMPASLFSSCTASLRDRRTVLPYKPVRLGGVDAHSDGLVHLVAGDDAAALLAVAAGQNFFLDFRFCAHLSLLALGRGGTPLALSLDRHDAGDVLPDQPQFPRIVQLARGVLEPQVEQLLARLAHAFDRVLRLTGRAAR